MDFTICFVHRSFKVQRALKKTSIRVVAKQMNVSRRTIQRTCRDMGLNGYKILDEPMITPTHIQKRIKFAPVVFYRENTDFGRF